MNKSTFNPDKFVAASKAAASWLNLVSLVAHYGESRGVDQAYRLLMPVKKIRGVNLQESYLEHADTLNSVKESLAALSDSPVKWEHGRGLSAIANRPKAVFPHRWSSAHEAALGIAALAFDLLIEPVAEITSPSKQWAAAEKVLTSCWQALTISTEEVADLQERIRRERAKLLKSSEASSKKEQEVANGPLPANGSKVKPANVPAELRELGRSNGVALTATYLAVNEGWEISSPDLTEAHHAGELTYRLKVGRSYAYLYTELCSLRAKRMEKKDAQFD